MSDKWIALSTELLILLEAKKVMTSTIVANLARGINRSDAGLETAKKNPRCSGDSLSDHKKSAIKEPLSFPIQVLQVISTPQHDGDLIIPQSLGHFDTVTVVPSSVVMWSCTSSCPHLTHVNPVTPIPHCPHT